MKRRILLIPTCVFAVLLTLLVIFAIGNDRLHDGTARAASDLGKGQIVIKPFDYRGVTIDGGHMKRLYDEVGESYLRLADVDDLLKGFRERAGKKNVPGRVLGPLYNDGTYHMFGQILSGLARYYAGTGDPAYKERVDRLVHEWGRTIESDGFFFITKPPKTTHYVYDKMVGGLVDAYLYCGNKEALTYLSKITAWSTKNLPQNRHPWTYAAEWYTLSENLYRAYMATGEMKYRRFAEVWHYWEYWDIYAKGLDIFGHIPWVRSWEAKPENYHAYSHVNTLSSAAMAYRVTGRKNYLATIENAYDYFMNNLIFATGGYGPQEILMPREGRSANLINSLNDKGIYKHFETQCGSWAVFKLSKYLLTFTGKAKYGDWVELLLYNGIGASLPTRSDGAVMYSSDYYLGGAVKVYADHPWSCCTGTRVQASADYIDQIYFHDDRNLYVNLFTPSSVVWQYGGTEVRLVQHTEFPESGKVEFTLDVPNPSRFGLRIRAPKWLAGPVSAKLNGNDVQLSLTDSGWLEIEREWSDGDRLEITLPMKLTVSRLSSKSTFPAAIMYGPVVLAIGDTVENPAKKINFDDLEGSLIPVPGKPLHFKVVFAEDEDRSLDYDDDVYEEPEPELIARPFYEFGEWERYFIYFDPKWSDRISTH